MQWYFFSLLILLILVLLGFSIGCLLLVWLPARMRPASFVFLSVPLGWAVVTMIAVPLGWFGPGYARCPCAAITLVLAVAGAWFGRDHLRRARSDCLRLIAFVPVASFPVLGPLLRIGNFSLYNDTYIYSAHALWLQHHPFWTPAQTDGGHPAWGAVVMFQHSGLRMGASFLLAWIQAAFRCDIPYRIFPAVAALASLCGALAVGATVPAACPRRWPEAWLAALAVAVTLNGFSLGAVQGFLPQTWGLAFAAAAFGLRGLELGAYPDRSRCAHWRVGLPLGLCVAASMHCYWDLLPLEGPALASTYLLPWHGWKPGDWKERWRQVRVPFFVGAGLVNFEWVRAASGILLNIHAVVANPVLWSVWDFPAHAVGLKSSVWEGSRWIFHDPSLLMLAGGCGVVLVWADVMWMIGRGHWRTRWKDSPARWNWRPLLPAFTWIGLSVALFVYFRYLVSSPWHGQAQGRYPDGAGQSWSQYKLTLWASFPVIGAVVALGTGWAARARSPSWRVAAVALLTAWCGTGLGWNYLFSQRRGAELLGDTNTRRDPLATCTAFRQKLAEVPSNDWIYLDWPDDGRGNKFRELMALLLVDHPLASNWPRTFSYVEDITPADAVRTRDDCQWVLRYRPSNSHPAEGEPNPGSLTLEKHAQR